MVGGCNGKEDLKYFGIVDVKLGLDVIDFLDGAVYAHTMIERFDDRSEVEPVDDGGAKNGIYRLLNVRGDTLILEGEDQEQCSVRVRDAEAQSFAEARNQPPRGFDYVTVEVRDGVIGIVSPFTPPFTEEEIQEWEARHADWAVAQEKTIRAPSLLEGED